MRHYDICYVVDDRHRLIFAHIDFHFSGFDFREIKYVVYDHQQIFSGIFNLGYIIESGGCQLFTKCHFSHADNRVHRRTDLVAHVC